MANIRQDQSATLVVANQDLADGMPIHCPHTLAAFVYLRVNHKQLHITQPRDSNEEDRAPYFICGDEIFVERGRDPIDVPLIGLSKYWKFDETKLAIMSDNEKANMNEYKERILRSLEPLRTFVFSRHGNNETDEELQQAIGSIRDLSNLLDHKCSFLEMNYHFVSEIEASFIAVAIIIWKKMEQSSLMQELQRHTALFGLAHKFMGMHVKPRPQLLDLSDLLVGNLAAKFKEYLENDCQKIGPHLVYCCNFPPDNEYGLPSGYFVVKTFPKLVDSKWFSSSYEAEWFNWETLNGYDIAAMLKAKAGNQDIQCVVLKYYPSGDLLSRVGDTSLTWIQALHILIRVSYIIHAIHSFSSPDKLVYNDFKPENFLMDGEDIVICDLASISSEGVMYMPQTKPYTEDVQAGVEWGKSFSHQRGDVFKLGKFIIALVTRIPLTDPISGDTVVNFRRVVLNRIDEQPLEDIMRLNMWSSGCQENNARDIIDLAIRCMDSNLENRPTADMIADRLFAIKEQSIG